MKYFVKNRLFVVIAGLGSLVLSHVASAEYHVTAFGDSIAYKALLARDASAAKSVFSGKTYSKLDFAALNNLCVAQILDRELDAAVDSCGVALDKVDQDPNVAATQARAAKASILSNMAVAKAMSGDIAGAASDIEKALMFNARDKNANSNQALISTRQDPGGLAKAI